ncbi:MAG TPA: lipocalin-like domain-containing protein [Blastocatellia bacterium]|nr:lipocalin-like domain-containing protein [Blastocatellia bacterium]
MIEQRPKALMLAAAVILGASVIPTLAPRAGRRCSKANTNAYGTGAKSILARHGQVSPERSPTPTEPAAANVESSTPEDWKVAEPGYRFAFPQDHASHEAYRIEWWYYTGNLLSSDGRRFGYQLTFFRTGIVANPANPSRWTVRDLYLAHFALSDIRDRSFHYFELLNRAGIGWAGAAASSYNVWNGEWSVRLDGGDHVLSAADGGYSLDLRLKPLKPETINGENGLSRKGPAPGNASHYYSITRLATRGTLVLGGERFQVTGLSWMDHEFGTSFLEPGQTGWDWFSIQMDDGRDLMLFEIRRANGAMDTYSSGTITAADGAASRVDSGQFSLAPGDRWRSPASGAFYPISWSIEIPGHALKLEAKAAFPDQELRTTESTGVTYWEGSIEVTGQAAGGPVHGRGYLEMTGYAGPGIAGLLH